MPKSSKPGYYAVKKGATPGIYADWATVEPLVRNFPGAQHKKFNTLAEAQDWLGMKMTYQQTATPTVLQSATTTISPPRTKPHQRSPRSGATASSKVLKETDVQDESGWDVVYTDGACSNNGGKGAKAGIGVWWGHDDPRNLSERCPGDQTNNRAELIAIIRALETTPPSDRPLLIKTDSSYSISCVRDWLPKWRQNGFRTGAGAPVKNIEVILFLSDLLEKRGKVRLQHIKGHAGHEGNEGADMVAVRGAWEPELPDRDWSIPEEGYVAHPAPQPTTRVASGIVAPAVPATVAPISSTMSRQTVPEPQAISQTSKPSNPNPNPPITANDLEDYASCLLSADELAQEDF